MGLGVRGGVGMRWGDGPLVAPPLLVVGDGGSLSLGVGGDEVISILGGERRERRVVFN